MEKIRKICLITCIVILVIGLNLLVLAMFWTNEYWCTPLLTRSPEDWLFIIAIAVIGIAVGLTVGVITVTSAYKKLANKS